MKRVDIEAEVKRILEELIYSDYEKEIPLNILKYASIKIRGGALIHSAHWKDFFDAFKLICEIKGWGKYDEERKVFVINTENEDIKTIFMRKKLSKHLYTVPYTPLIPKVEKEVSSESKTKEEEVIK